MKFENRDIVCFLGDSITAGGWWLAEVYQYLRKKYKLKCYNCGVSGGTVNNALKYLHSKCLAYNPDYVVIMFGINDIQIDAYIKNDSERISAALDLYKSGYTKLLNEIETSGATPIICVPVPYDEISDNETENARCQWGLDIVAQFLRETADKNGYMLVDFGEVMKPMLGKRNIMREDRVHPTEEGHHVMAEIFLNATGGKAFYDFDTKFEFETWNKLRFDAEQKLHKFNFVELCAFLDNGWYAGKSAEEKKKMAQTEYEKTEDKTGFIGQAYKEYAEILDMYDKIHGEIIKLTIF